MKHRILSALLAIIPILITGACATTGKTAGEQALAGPPVITGITLADNQVEIRASGPFTYTIYKPSDPYRVSIDLPGTLVGTYKDRIVSNAAGISEVVPSQVESPATSAKIELLLQNPTDVEPQYHENVLTLRVKDVVEARPAAAPPVETPVAQAVAEEKIEAREVKADPPAETPKAEQPIEQAAQPPAQAPAMAKATDVTDIRFDQRGGTVELVIRGNGSLSPAVFTLGNRIVIDLPDTGLKAKVPSTVVAPVKGVRAGKHKDKTRLVVDLREMRPFDVSTAGDAMTIAFTGAAPVIAKQETAATKEQPKAEMRKAEETKVAETKPEPKPEPKPEARAQVNAGSEAPAPVPELRVETKETDTIVEGRYTGKKVSLDFQDADILPIFRLLSDISGYNIVVGPEVKGKITMKLINVPWDQALDLILKTFSLDKSVDGNIIRIASNAVFVKEREEKAKAKEAMIKAEPLETRIYPVSYADVSVVEKTIRDSKVLSARGSISIDKRTSQMVVKDVGSVFPHVEQILGTLDKPTPQVIIEARIVEMDISMKSDIGVQWGLNLKGANTLSSIGGLSSLGRGPFTGGNYLVDFPSGASAGSGSGFTFGFLSPDKTIGLDLQLSAVETTGQGKIISNPRIMTVDNEKARILQGKSIPVRKLTTEGTISSEFKDVAVELIVTPHITPEKSVSIKIDIKKEELDPTIPSIEGVPGTDKKEASTNVILRNGETFVIGGMYKVSSSDTDTGVPGLHKLPVLGWLFKNEKKEARTTELLIFITPKIVEKP